MSERRRGGRFDQVANNEFMVIGQTGEVVFGANFGRNDSQNLDVFALIFLNLAMEINQHFGLLVFDRKPDLITKYLTQDLAVEIVVFGSGQKVVVVNEGRVLKTIKSY